MENIIIQTNSLSFGIGKKQILNNISLNVPEGSIFGFLGPNGAGKTTTIRILLGLIPVKPGNVSIFGKDITKAREEILSKTGAFVEQSSLYPHLTGWENLQIAQRLHRVSKERIEEVLKIVNMNEDAHRKVKTYSLGMKQRISLALALINDPKLLVLDEPTNGLDPKGIREIRDLIIRLQQHHGKTIFISSHLLPEVEKMCSHVSIIHQGQQLYSGDLSMLGQASSHVLQLETNDAATTLKLLRSQNIEASNGSTNLVELLVKDREEIAAINRFLVEKGIKVYTIHREASNLENVFLEITNK